MCGGNRKRVVTEPQKRAVEHCVQRSAAQIECVRHVPLPRASIVIGCIAEAQVPVSPHVPDTVELQQLQGKEREPRRPNEAGKQTALPGRPEVSSAGKRVLRFAWLRRHLEYPRCV